MKTDINIDSLQARPLAFRAVRSYNLRYSMATQEDLPDYSGMGTFPLPVQPDRFGGTSSPALYVESDSEQITYSGMLKDETYFELTEHPISGETEVTVDTQFGSVPLLFGNQDSLTNIVIDPFTAILNLIDRIETDEVNERWPEYLRKKIQNAPQYVVEILPERAQVVVDYDPESEGESDESTALFALEPSEDNSLYWSTYLDEEEELEMRIRQSGDDVSIELYFFDEPHTVIVNRTLPYIGDLFRFPLASTAQKIRDELLFVNK